MGYIFSTKSNHINNIIELAFLPLNATILVQYDSTVVTDIASYLAVQI